MARPTPAELQEKIIALQKELAKCKNSEGRQTDRELCDQQDRYKRLFQDAPMGILVVDAQTHIIDANRQALQILAVCIDDVGLGIHQL